MSDQKINEDNDVIQNVEDTSWNKGSCPPAWEVISIHSEQYNEVYN